jgi:hypothetical protein
MVVALSPNGRIAMLAGTRTSDAGITGDEDGCAGVSVVINDACGEAKQVGFGHYFESQQLPGAGFTASIEADSVNLSGVVSPLNPYSMFQDSTVNIWLGAGGNRPGSINSSAAIGIVQNGAKYEKGIVFQTGSISSNEAIAFASGHAIQWWGADGVPTSFVQSTTHSTPGGIVFADRGIYFGNNGATVGGFLVPYVDGAVDFVTAIGAKAGGFVQVAADGQDANIGLALTPKGNGLLILGGINQTPSGAPINGLEVINARDGQTYVIPLYRKV